MPGIDKNGVEIDFGDYVHYFIPGHGGHGGYGYVAGEMNYSEDGSHVLLVNEGEIGMPIHAGHCQFAGGGRKQDLVRPWRDRYLSKWPTALKPLPQS